MLRRQENSPPTFWRIDAFRLIDLHENRPSWTPRRKALVTHKRKPLVQHRSRSLVDSPPKGTGLRQGFGLAGW